MPGKASGELTFATRRGLRAFQKRHELEVTGQPNDETRAKLVELYGA